MADKNEVVKKPAPLSTLTPETIEQAIMEISTAMKRLNASRLRRDAVITLIHDRCKIGKRDIETILNSLDELEQHYLKPR